MQCQICHTTEATIHMEGDINGNKKTLYICSSCADKHHINPESLVNLSLVNVLTKGLELVSDASESVPPVPDAVCHCCLLRSTEFQETGRLGCAECYTVFGNYLGAVLGGMHKGVRHLGKTPPNFSEDSAKEVAVSVAVEEPLSDSVKVSVVEDNAEANDDVAQLDELRSLLDEAVAAENYELAARLRDRILQLTD